MQQVNNIKDLKAAINENGEMVITLSDNNIVIMKMEEYKNKLLEDEIEKKLLKAETQINEGKTVKATEVFKELKKQYDF
jgi:PHD/YefM family antitoxin component YafN of YafNO toxin-antitoxin module